MRGASLHYRAGVTSSPKKPSHDSRPANGAPLERTLLVLSRFGVLRKALGSACEWTVGRGDDCDVRIEDAKASRRHCVLRFGEALEVEDLGSRNGTLLGERRLEPRRPTPLSLGTPITIGATVLIVQHGPSTRAPVVVSSSEVFADRVESERIDAARAGRSFAIVEVRFERGDAVGVETYTRSVAASAIDAAGKLESGLRELVRPGDALTYIGPGEYRVLLVGASAELAEHHAATLRESLRARQLSAAVGVAVYPREGRTVADLYDAAHAGLRGASPAPAPAAQLDRGALARLAPLIERVAAGRINVLVLGETGVGKEVLARTLHERSPRVSEPMVCINCAALAESVLESELFGHERGAFTGATGLKVGLLESANRGTVFLDEVGEMPAALQAKLLRVLEQREVLRVGGLRPVAIDVRIIAATNRDLDSEVAAGRFREDLFYRLSGMTLTIPPLRERVDEIEPLARAFAARAAEASGGPAAASFTAPAMAVLLAYPWPGNIRELRNVVERAVMLSAGEPITLDHLPLERLERRLPVSELGAASASKATIAPLPRRVPERDGDERARIEEALARCGGNQTKAAKALGVSRRTLVSRIAEYAIRRPRDD